MGSLTYRNKIELPDLPPSPEMLRNVKRHFRIGILWSLAGVTCAALIPFLLGIKGILAVVIAVPPAILCGNAWVQIIRKHPLWIERNASYFSLLNRARRNEPVLFWLGIVGALGICGLTFLLAGIPTSSSLGAWVTDLTFPIQLAALYAIMIGCSAVPMVVFLRRRMKEWHKRERVSARLAASFIENYDYHKN